MKSPLDGLRDILAECRFLVSHSKGMELSSFLNDPVMQRAFARSIEIIGEAVKALPESLVISHSDIPWRRMAGMRDRLIHGYFAVDYSLVWDVVISRIPELEKGIEGILSETGT